MTLGPILIQDKISQYGDILGSLFKITKECFDRTEQNHAKCSRNYPDSVTYPSRKSEKKGRHTFVNVKSREFINTQDG